MITPTSSHRKHSSNKPNNQRELKLKSGLSSGEFCQPDLFISIKINIDVSMLPVIGGQVRWRYQNIRYCLGRETSPSKEYLIISL